MCGIIGYVGESHAMPILLEGLKRLEYRGYDSAGIAIRENGSVLVEKTKGKISELEALLGQQFDRGAWKILRCRCGPKSNS